MRPFHGRIRSYALALSLPVVAALSPAAAQAASHEAPAVVKAPVITGQLERSTAPEAALVPVPTIFPKSAPTTTTSTQAAASAAAAGTGLRVSGNRLVD